MNGDMSNFINFLNHGYSHLDSSPLLKMLGTAIPLFVVGISLLVVQVPLNTWLVNRKGKFLLTFMSGYYRTLHFL